MLPTNLTDTDAPVATPDQADTCPVNGQENVSDNAAERPTGSWLTAKELRLLKKSLKKHEAAYRYLGR